MIWIFADFTDFADMYIIVIFSQFLQLLEIVIIWFNFLPSFRFFGLLQKIASRSASICKSCFINPIYFLKFLYDSCIGFRAPQGIANRGYPPLWSLDIFKFSSCLFVNYIIQICLVKKINKIYLSGFFTEIEGTCRNITY